MESATYQFGHVSWAARAGAKKRKSRRENSMTTRDIGWSAQDIASEAMRIEGHCEHVESPEPPRVLYGVDALEAASIASAWGDQAKTTSGGKERALQRNAPVMACGVVSWPRERMDEWPAYRDATVEALKERYGDRLKSVVEHLDERHPHVHFYVVPRPGESFGAVHEGYAASREARKTPENKIRTAYQDAMRRWQDWLHAAVGQPFGLERIGPARERREREEQLRLRAIEDAQKTAAAAHEAAAQAEALRDAAERDHQAALAMRAEYEKRLLLLDQQQDELAGQLRDVRRERRALERQAGELDERDQQRMAELDAVAVALKAERAEIKEARRQAVIAGRAQGMQQAATTKIATKIGVALGVVRESLGETAAERELREQVERDKAEKARMARALAEAQTEADRRVQAERERADRERADWMQRAEGWERRERELMDLYADADNELEALKRGTGRGRRLDE